MSDPPTVNPYAPGRDVSSRPAENKVQDRGSGVGSLAVCLGTIGCCALAGGLFGITTVIVFALAAFSAPGTAFWQVPVFALWAGIIGFCLALASSVPVVAVLFAITLQTRKAGYRWHRGPIKNFAFVSGLLSGYLPILLFTGFEAEGAAVSCIPAGFGAVAARLMIRPLARRAGDSPEPLSTQGVGN